MITRVTHHKDIVPHLPVSVRYMHTSGEYYQEGSTIKECQGYEDPLCANQWKATNIDDHVYYLGQPVGCEKKAFS